MATSYYHHIHLSLTENWAPVTIPVWQGENYYRIVCCHIYDGDDTVSLNDYENIYIVCSGTRSDGGTFEYSSELSSNVWITSTSGYPVFRLTEFMTAVPGLVHVDVAIVNMNGTTARVLTLSPIILSVKKVGD